MLCCSQAQVLTSQAHGSNPLLHPHNMVIQLVRVEVEPLKHRALSNHLILAVDHPAVVLCVVRDSSVDELLDMDTKASNRMQD